MFAPAFATALQDAALAVQHTAKALWVSLRTTNREIATSLGISATVHIALLLIFGTALYVSGEDDRDLPELSVQLETREGPSSEEYTEAALPRPAPEPVEQELDDPGTSSQTFDAEAYAHSQPQPEIIPETADLDSASAFASLALTQEPVLTTTGDSDSQIASITEPATTLSSVMPQVEKTMVTKNVTEMAQKLLDSDLRLSELSWEQDGQQYSARVLRQPAPDSTGLEQVIAEVTTEKDGKRMKTRLALKRLAFSHFTQLINTWDPAIALHDDVIDGRFHSNTEIGIAFAGGIKPQFLGKVTTSAARMTLSSMSTRRRNQEVFRGGMETNTERVTLPRDMPDVINGGAEGNRQLFAEDTRIIFNSDGSFVWRHANGDGPLQRAEASEYPRYLIGEKGAKLYVRGTVAGIFTVYSPSDIEIEGDITYAKDPRHTVLSRDFLALISSRDIRVSNTQVTGVGDLHIQAALFARRTFIIESVDRGKVGKLVILGSLTAGTIQETEPRYATQMDFDKRFEYLRPASFPMTRRYEVDSWEQDWQEVEGANATPAGLVRTD